MGARVEIKFQFHNHVDDYSKVFLLRLIGSIIFHLRRARIGFLIVIIVVRCCARRKGEKFS